MAPIDILYQKLVFEYCEKYSEPVSSEDHLRDGKREREFGILLGIRSALIDPQALPKYSSFREVCNGLVYLLLFRDINQCREEMKKVAKV